MARVSRTGRYGLGLLALFVLAQGAAAQHLSMPEPELSAGTATAGAGAPRVAPSPDPPVRDEIRGLVKPRSEALISSQIEGRITELPVDEGAAFAKGDVLVTFDCAMHRARLTAARAEHTAASKTHENNLELAALGAISGLEVELSEAQAAKARAEVEVARVQVSRCRITAPYDGRVVSHAVNPHESVSPNEELLSILDDGELEIELIVPSHWLTWLRAGSEFFFRVDETGGEHAAEVTRIGAAADPVSQTVRLEARFRGDPADVLAGMSGTARFPAPGPARATP